MKHDRSSTRTALLIALAYSLQLNAQSPPVAEPAPDEVVSMPGERGPIRTDRAKPAPAFLTDPARDAGLWGEPLRLDAFDATALAAEDVELDATPGTPMRVGVVRDLPKPIAPDQDGAWGQTAGAAVWTWVVEAPGAVGIRLHVNKLDLPEGTRLVVSGEQGEPPVAYYGNGPIRTPDGSPGPDALHTWPTTPVVGSETDRTPIGTPDGSPGPDALQTWPTTPVVGSDVWTPVFAGSVLRVEFQDPTGQAAAPLIEFDQIAHLYRGMDSFRTPDGSPGPDVTQSGPTTPVVGSETTPIRTPDGSPGPDAPQAGPTTPVVGSDGASPLTLLPCQQDVMCYSVNTNARDAVAAIFFNSGGFSYACSGALLADFDPNTLAGYFLTANHCLDTQDEVNTMTPYWFYQTNTCNGSVGWLTGVTGGTLLATWPGNDFSFIRLADDPENGQGFAAWTTAPPSGTVRGIHHPGGSYKRFSDGSITTQQPFCDNPAQWYYSYNDWTTGITEGGSSGSPLFNSSWQIVGQLRGKCSFGGTTPGCNNPQDFNTMYGRFYWTYQSIYPALYYVAPDDAYEPNDTLGQAPILAPGTYNLKLVDFDDYFTVDACAPLTITASATFNNAQMDLDLQLLTSVGVVLSNSTGSGSLETVNAFVPAGSYRVRANKDHGWGGDYTLNITLSNFPDCNGNTTPDACEPDCNANSTPDDCDIAGPASDDCNTNAIPDECDIAGGTSNDCDESDVPDECETDCNGNRLEDACDIAEGTSDDCNANDTPDECETDCDASGVPDDCEIAAGTAQDADSNGVPDTCQLIYVNVAQLANPPDGRTWATAYRDVQSAIQRADAIQDSGVNVGTEVWVAQGVYYPDIGPGITNNDRNATFLLRSDVALYGGFDGTETALDQRDVDTNATILSGDLLVNDGPLYVEGFIECYSGPGVAYVPGCGPYDRDSDNDVDQNDRAPFLAANNYGDNSYHVTTGSGTDDTGVLDGFTLTHGHAVGAGGGTLVDIGAGMLNVTGSPTVRNCLFTGNFSLSGGAGMRNQDGSNPTVTDCKFVLNLENDDGAGMLNISSNPTVTNCVFDRNLGNIADPNNGGGGMANHISSPTVTGCVFTGNSSSGGTPGGGMFNASSSSTLTDCTFQHNSARSGGAIYNLYSNLTLMECEFSSNGTSPGGGGGAIADEVSGDLIVTGCTFEGNQADSGAGAILTSKSSGSTRIVGSTFTENTCNNGHGGAVLVSVIAGAEITDCTFISNTNMALGAGDFGGGAVAVQQGASLTITRGRFFGNTSGEDGAAINLHNGSSLLAVNSIFGGNVASSNGGAVSLRINEQGGPSSANFANCSFTGNSATYGGACAVRGANSIMVWNCTFSRNHGGTDGGGMFVDIGSSVTVSNSVLWGNTDSGPQDASAQLFSYPSETAVSYCDLQGGWLLAGTNNIDADPLFVNAVGTNGVAGDEDDDLRLRELSPCIDVGQMPTLVGHWRFDEASGTAVFDSSGNGLNGTLVGSVSRVAGIVGGGALSFDPSADHVLIAGDDPILDFTDSFSLSFWVNASPNQPGTGGEQGCALIDKSHGGFANSGWAVQARTAEPGAISMVVVTGIGTAPEPRIPGVLDNTWHHVAITVTTDPSIRIRGYVDGAMVTNFTAPETSLAPNDLPLYFGVWWGSGGPLARQFQGLLEEVRLFDGELSSTFALF